MVRRIIKKKKTIKRIRKCQSCGSKRLIESGGVFGRDEIICNQCKFGFDLR